jgi:hypothetical protein
MGETEVQQSLDALRNSSKGYRGFDLESRSSAPRNSSERRMRNTVEMLIRVSRVGLFSARSS